MIFITFVSKKNKEFYSTKILDWLETDYNKKRKPSDHFWHNVVEIANAFRKRNALVSLNDDGVITGFMTWSFHDARLEIDVVEVKARYRRQGILKTMLSHLIEKFPEVMILTASVVKESQEIFKHLGWLTTSSPNPRFYKILKDLSPELEELPAGLALEVPCLRKHGYTSGKKIEKKRYFSLAYDLEQRLILPIVALCSSVSYVSIYADNKLIATDIISELFKEAGNTDGLIILEKLIPTEHPALSFVKQDNSDEEYSVRKKRPRSFDDALLLPKEKKARTLDEEENFLNTDRDTTTFSVKVHHPHKAMPSHQ